MNVLFLAYANRREEPLPGLQQEDDEVYRLLSGRALQQHFLLHRDSYAALDRVAYFLTLYRDQLALFLYSGHAGRDALLLEDSEAAGAGVAHLLGQCPNLRLVVLNGCSTHRQVERLLDAGVPAVIATSAPVDDSRASRFAVRLFQGLNEYYSLQEAFELAAGEALSRPGTELPVERGLLRRERAAEAPLWGLFVRPDRPDAAGWKLPAAPAVAAGGDYEPNAVLIRTLLEAFAPYSERVRRLQEAELLGAEKSLVDKREAILECLPHPVSEQLRKLLVPQMAGADGIFFDRPGPDRLRQMTAAYRTIIELMAFVMLAQLWDALNEQPALRLPAEEAGTVRRLFRLSPAERSAYNFFPLIRDLRRIFDENAIPYFVEELSRLKNLFGEDTPFSRACQFLENLKDRLSARPSFDAATAANLCVLAEENLAALLQELGFLANYTLTSVKEIGVIKDRRLRSPRYRHSLVKLVLRLGGLAEEQDVLEEVMDSASVLLEKKKDGHRHYLNLTPFVIDESAFDAKVELPKIHFFDRYEPAADACYFKHVYKPDDPPLVVGNQRNYLLLKSQFDAFAQLLFQQPNLRAL